MQCRGSRMHVLDWIDGAGGSFPASMNELLKPTGALVFESSKRMPEGWRSTDEACLGRQCRDLIHPTLNQTLNRWWLVNPGNAPNWDLICTAQFPDSRPGLVLVEAKANVPEFMDGIKGSGVTDPENSRQIAQAIEEARSALSAHESGVKLSRDRWFQVSNRLAFAWKLASEGMPTVLMYLGFTGDEGIRDRGEPLKDDQAWRTLVMAEQDVIPPTLWERKILVGDTPLWFLIRSRECIRPSPTLDAFRLAKLLIADTASKWVKPSD